MLHSPFGEEIFPNFQSKPPLAQLETISYCPIAYYLRGGTDAHLTTTSFQVVVESDKFSPCMEITVLLHLATSFKKQKIHVMY